MNVMICKMLITLEQSTFHSCITCHIQTLLKYVEKLMNSRAKLQHNSSEFYKSTIATSNYCVYI